MQDHDRNSELVDIFLESFIVCIYLNILVLWSHIIIPDTGIPQRVCLGLGVLIAILALPWCPLSTSLLNGVKWGPGMRFKDQGTSKE